MKRVLSLLLLCCSLLLSACGKSAADTADTGESVELVVFAAASMQETLEEIAQLYQEEAPGVTLVYSFESSGTLLKNIEAGAECDLFISAAPTQMDVLEEAGSLLEGTRLDLLENKVVLAVRNDASELPEDAGRIPANFDELAERLGSRDILLAIGNSDVPVGQYTQKIFSYYGLEETSLAEAGCLTYGSNVKEVTTQVSEAAVDCGIIYATDAFSAGLNAVDTATPQMCGQVIYPAAVLAASRHQEEAQAFLNYLTGPEAAAVFERVGFTPIS